MRKQLVDVEALTESVNAKYGIGTRQFRFLPKEEQERIKRQAEAEKRQLMTHYRAEAYKERRKQKREEAKPNEQRAVEAWEKYKAAEKGGMNRKHWKNYAITCALKAIDEGKADKMPPHLVSAAEKARQPRAERAARVKAYGPTLYRVSELDEQGGLMSYRDHGKKEKAEKAKAYREAAGKADRVTITELKAESQALAVDEAAALLAEIEATRARARHYRLAEPKRLQEAAELWRRYLANGGQHAPTAKIAEALEATRKEAQK